MLLRAALSLFPLLGATVALFPAGAAAQAASHGAPSPTAAPLAMMSEPKPRTNSADVAAAEALFQEARRLTAEGRYAEACPKFEESNRLDPALGTLLYLADCYEEMGRTASAWATFELAASEGRKANQAKREVMARERAKALEARLSKLSIVVAEGAKVDGLLVVRDKTEVGDASLGVPLPVDPGEHIVKASAPGYEPWQKGVQVGDNGDHVTVEVPPLEPVAVEAAGDAPSPPESSTLVPPPRSTDTSATSGPSTQRILGLSLGGLGVVGLGVGTYLYMDSKAKEDEAKDYCYAPDYSVCFDGRGVDLVNAAETELTFSFISGSLGIASLAAGAVLYFTAPSDETSAMTTIVPMVEQGRTGLRVSGEF